MAQSLAQIVVHLVFSTKDRQKTITPDLKPRLHAYLAKTLRAHGCLAHRVGGVSDHVHICLSLSKTLSISEAAAIVKGESSKWVKKQGVEHLKFYWQSGYGAFSISPGHKEALIEYIDDQEAHHQTVDFKEEFRGLCERYDVAIDERYVWD